MTKFNTIEEYRQLAPGNSVHTFLYNTTDSRSKLC